MLSIPHVVVGVAIGAAVGDPVGGLILGAASHHVLDTIPHWDVGSFYPPGAAPENLSRRDIIIAAADGLMAAALLTWLVWRFANGHPWPLIAGGVGSLVPDLWHHIPWWKRWTRAKTGRWFRFHARWHWTVRQSQMLWGVLTQLGVMALGWWWLVAMR